MELEHKKIKKYCIIALVVLLLICVSVKVTFAWLMQIREVKQEVEMQMDDMAIAGIAFTAIKYDISTNLASIVTGEDIKLPLYDSVFVEKNDTSCLIFRAPVFGRAIQAGDSFTITLDLADCSETTQLSDNNYKDALKPDQNDNSKPAIAQYLSNVVYVKCGVIEELQVESFDATNIYTTAKTFFSGATGYETRKFVNNGTKSGEISFTISNYANKMAENSTVLYLYLEIGYDDDLVKALVDSRGLELSGDSISSENTIIVPGDMEQFIFAVANS